MTASTVDSSSQLAAFVRFRLAIVGGFILIVAGVLGMIMAIVDSSQRRQADEGIRRELGVTRTVFLDALGRRGRRVSDSVRLLGADYAFRSVMATQDPDTIASFAMSLRERIGADAIWVVGRKGLLLADTTGRIPIGRSMLETAAVRTALEERQSATSIEVLGGSLHQISAVPIDQPEMLGVLVAGFPFDNVLAADFKRLTGSEVSLASGGRIVASTLASQARESLQASLGRFSADNVGLVELAGDRNLVMTTPVPPIVTAYLMRSLDEALSPSRRLRRLLAITSLGGLALTAALGFLVVGLVTRSIQALFEKLRGLNDDLAQINSFQNRFFFTVAHDVSNPLAASVGFAELLSADAQDPRQKQCVDGIIKALNTLQFLISDLVDIAAIQSGKLRVAKIDMDLLEVVREIQGRMEIIAQKKQMTFRVVAPNALPRFQGDPRRLAQVLQNLCSNALNYNRPGGEVVLRAEALPGSVRLSVQDNGIGIAPQDLPKIFNRFFQAENARTHRGGGLGLGLKIAVEIVAAHGGQIDVKSELNKGSVFFFSIPVAAPASAAPAAPV